MPRISQTTVTATGTTTPRTLAARFGDVLNVRDFGAVGDGVTDDTAAIQAALDAITSGTFGGGTVIIPAGTYLLSSSLSPRTGTIIRGVGAGRTRILAPAAVPAITIGSAAPSTSVKRVQVRNLLIDGAAGASTTGIQTRGESSQLTFADLWLESLNVGIDSQYTYFVTCDNVRSISARATSFLLEAASNAWTLVNCSTNSSFATHYAVIWHNSAGLSITGPMFEGVSSSSFYTCQGVSVSGGYFENATATTLDAWIYLGFGAAAQGVSITGNCFNYGARYGIDFYETLGVDISGNYFGTTYGAVQAINDGGKKRWMSRVGMNAYSTSANWEAVVKHNVAPSQEQAILVSYPEGRVAVTYSATMAIRPHAGDTFVITPTDGTGFTISAPDINDLSDDSDYLVPGQRLTIQIVNSRGSGGTLGAATFTGGAGGYRVATWTQPADGYSRAVTFAWDGTNWVEVSRTPADVPN